MAKPVTLKAGQFLLFVFAVFMIGAGSGVLTAGLYWHVHGFVTLAAPMEILGAGAFVIMSIWKSVDDWVGRTGYTPPTRT